MNLSVSGDTSVIFQARGLLIIQIIAVIIQAQFF